jgi:hypothetical protein
MKPKHHLVVSKIVSAKEGPDWAVPVWVKLRNATELPSWAEYSQVLVEDGIRAIELSDVLILSQKWILTDDGKMVEIILSAEELLADTGLGRKLSMWCNG